MAPSPGAGTCRGAAGRRRTRSRSSDQSPAPGATAAASHALCIKLRHLWFAEWLCVPCCSEKIANDCLKQTGWSVEAAIEVFYSGGYASASPAVDTNKIERLFLQYKGDATCVVGNGGLWHHAPCYCVHPHAATICGRASTSSPRECAACSSYPHNSQE